MRIVSVDHVQLAMPPGEESKARAFYEGVLGIPEQPKPPHLAKRGGAWFERGAVKVHLGVDPDFRASAKAHTAFLVEQLPELVARCTAAGYRVVTDEPLEGYDRVYVYDPFGNRLELMEPVNDGDDRDDEERERLHRSIERGRDDVEAGRTVDARQVIEKLRARAAGS